MLMYQNKHFAHTNLIKKVRLVIVAKRFIKAEMWLLLYFVVQSLIMVGVMLYQINSDVEFANSLTDVLLESVYAESTQVEHTQPEGESTQYTADNYTVHSRITNSIELVQSITPHLSSVLIPTCIISSAIILAVYVTAKWTNAREQSISWQDALKYVTYALVANSFITFIIELLPQSITATHQAGTDIALSGNFFIVLLSTGVLVPIMEEIVFRCGIGETIGGRVGLIYQAVIFGLLHGNLIQIIYAFGLGLWFGVENMRKNSILPGIIMHITFNASTVMAEAIITLYTSRL